MQADICKQLNEQGFAGPVTVLTEDECRRFLDVLSSDRRRPPMDWLKGNAVVSRPFYEIGSHPAIMSIVEAALGGNVIFWGASVLSQKSGLSHPWHSDIETSGLNGSTLSVWIGLENINVESSLQFISHSHRFGATVQEVRQVHGKARHEATTENIVTWASQRDERAKLIKPDMTVGQALFFQGQAWHYSNNQCGQTRKALLLQYATPQTPIRMPDGNSLDWPFKQRENPRPPCVMIRGTDNSGVNRIVPAPVPPARGAGPQLTDQVYPLATPLASDSEKGFKLYTMFSGATPDLRDMEVHTSVLNQGQIPHPPHTHKEEEILIMLTGEADLLLPQVKGIYGDERHPLKAGEFAYYPAHFPHSLRTTSSQPANYLMFKWHADHGATPADKSPLAFGHFSTLDPALAASAPNEMKTRLLFEGPTQCLRKLHCHVSALAPGGGYAPHIDAYDVAIVVFEGEIETMGQRVGPHTTIFHAAGQPHGLRNPGTVPARYVVFEFHGSQAAQSEAFPKPKPTLFQKITDPQRWKRKLKNAAGRIRGR